MIYRLKHILPLLALCAILPACSDYDVFDDPSIGRKTPIELSVGGMDVSSPSQTRAVITDGTNKSLQAFNENTSLYMLMKSDHVSDASKPALVTRTIMFALPQVDNNKNYSEVDYSASNEESKFVRYWEDSYSRSSALSILAVCTPGMGAGVDKKAWRTGGDAAYSDQGWTTISGDGSYPQIEWPIGESNKTDQSVYTKDKKNVDVSFIKNQDLCFSNNIGDWSGNGGQDRRLKYDFTNKRFPNKTDQWGADGPYQTRMIFYHALSKLTFKIKEGSGFAEGKFKFDKENNADTNIKLSNFNNSGTFNIEEGEFIANTLTTDPIQKIHECTLSDAEKNNGYKYILDALVIPGTDMTATDVTGVTFTIDNNKYNLSMNQLYSAFSSENQTKYFDNGKLKAGVHYIINLTVGKTTIEKITAQLVPWEEVVSDDFAASNARIHLDLLDKGEAQTSGDVKIYRALNYCNESAITDDWSSYDWQTKQYEGTTPTYRDGHWTTSWFWGNNREFYHFRAIIGGGNDFALKGNEDSNPNPTYNPTFDLKAKKKVSDTDTYKDVKWGAPFLDPDNTNTYKLTYSTSKGFDGKNAEDDKNPKTHQIYKAIGPTKETIKLVTLHMMCEVTIEVKTTSSLDMVNLGDGNNGNVTKVELQNLSTSATVQMGDGLVSPANDKVNVLFNETVTNVPESQSATWGMIPQSLDGVVLCITTADHNQYLVNLNEVKISKKDAQNPDNLTANNLANPYDEDSDGKYIIDSWYPGYKYKYVFTLTKKGIDNLKATIVDWETVTADDETVQIK